MNHELGGESGTPGSPDQGSAGQPLRCPRCGESNMAADVRCWACDAELHPAPPTQPATAEPAPAEPQPAEHIPPAIPDTWLWTATFGLPIPCLGCAAVLVCAFLGAFIGHLTGGVDDELAGAMYGVVVGLLLEAVLALALWIRAGAQVLVNLRREVGPPARRAAPTACMVLGAAIGLLHGVYWLVLGGALGFLAGLLLQNAWDRAQSIPWVAQLFPSLRRRGRPGTGPPPPPTR